MVSISASLADHPIAGVTASVPMITKGGIESISKNLAMEYAKAGIRFNSVAPGIVDTPLHSDDPTDVLRTLSPWGASPTLRKSLMQSCSWLKRHTLPGKCCMSTAART